MSRAAGKPSDVIPIFMCSSVVHKTDTRARLIEDGAKDWPSAYFLSFEGDGAGFGWAGGESS